jgi:RNA polymerase primary sigma factor
MPQITTPVSGTQPTDSLRQRAVRLLQAEIDFIPNPDFAVRVDGPDGEITAGLSTHGKEGAGSAPLELPPHLRRLCETELLNPQQEMMLFREMNFAKFHADRLRSRLDLAAIDPELMAQAEQLLDSARLLRDRIIQANMRLVMSIVKKFVTPRQSFDEMLSDGIMTLMQAVEKFDYDRGFRFSTYAYRAIARSAYRSVVELREEELTSSIEAESWASTQEVDGKSSALTDQVWSNLRQLTAAMLSKLDRRERLVIRSRYALGSHRKVRSFQDLANRLGVSKERVRQLEQRAISKLQVLAAELEHDEIFGAALA